jgi:hypothetical protein
MKECSYCGRENPDDAANCSGCGLDEFKSAPVAEVATPDDLVLLTTCTTLPEADVLVSRLGAAGIKAFIPDEYLMQNMSINPGAFGFVRVEVSQENYPAAKDLLEAPEAKPEDLPPAPAAPDGKKVIASLAAGQADAILECLKAAGIPVEVKAIVEESGLEMSELLVADADYGRSCDAVEAWSAEVQAEAKKRTGQHCGKCGSPNVDKLPHEDLGYYYRCKDCGYEFPP